MIQVSVKKQKDNIVGFHMEGHSGYAEQGADIVCSAISALAINCVNSIEEFTEDLFSVGSDEERVTKTAQKKKSPRGTPFSVS